MTSVANGSAGKYKVNETVQFYSASYSQWIDTYVTQVRDDGAVQVTCKPGAWITIREQETKMRPGGGQPAQAASAPAAAAKDRRPTISQLKMIQAVLVSPNVTAAHARQWFKNYDQNRNNLLEFNELVALTTELNSQLGIPPAEEKVMYQCLKKFDVDGNDALDFDEFYQFYFRVLMRCKQRYAQFKVKRQFFLDKQAGSPYDNYNTIKKLGQGTFGVAYLVEDRRSRQQRVLKTVNKAKAQMPPEELEQEIKVLKEMDHPHIIKLFEYYEDFNNIYMIMESASGGELLEVIKENYNKGFRLTEGWVATVMQQVLEAIAYCHGRRLMHKDLKAENIMLLTDKESISNPHAVVIDLGLAEMFTAGGRSSKCGGTPYTMAPEVWESAIGGKGFGPKCDVFSLGVVTFQLLTGTIPFSAPSINPNQWLAALKQPPPLQKLGSGTSKECVELVRSMLIFDDVRRPTANEALRYPWFQQAVRSEVQLSAEQMNHLCKFEQKNELERLVLEQIASQMQAKDIPHINAIFREVDKDNSGYLNQAELQAALTKLGVDAANAKKAAVAIDLDGDGRVEYTEFVAACLSMFDDRLDSMLWQAFSRFDKDNSGSLDIHEIRELLNQGQLNNLGVAPHDKEIEKMIAELDRDGNGSVSFDEFRFYFSNPSPCMH